MTEEQFAEATIMVEDAMNEQQQDTLIDQKVLSVSYFLFGLAVGIAVISFCWNLSVGAF